MKFGSELSEWIQTYSVQLVRIASMYSRDQSAAEDCVQDAFIKAYKAIHQLHQRDNPFPGYSLSVWYQYSDNRQIYLTVYVTPMKEALDNVHKVRIGDRWATVGETPHVYADNSGTIQARATYVLDYFSSRGVQYRIAGDGFSSSDLVRMMQSISTQ